MLKRKPVDMQINHERWLVSYADFVTLLFAFFVVMYSVSQVNEEKYEELSDTLNELFSQQEQQFTGGENFEEKRVLSLPAIEADIDKKLAQLIEQGAITVTSNDQWLQVSLNNAILFEPGSVKPSQQASTIMADIADVLRDTKNPINVEGFTDNVAIQTEQFPSNWQLSAARAAAIVQLLVSGGVSPEQLSAIGYGEFKPIADNTTATGRAQNRRVSLMISKYQQQRPETDSFWDSHIKHTDDITHQDETLSTSHSSTNEASVETDITPITLDNGELLFTSDPDAN
ncbi:flagellar motor protein MotB [Eionea flava]